VGFGDLLGDLGCFVGIGKALMWLGAVLCEGRGLERMEEEGEWGGWDGNGGWGGIGRMGWGFDWGDL